MKVAILNTKQNSEQGKYLGVRWTKHNDKREKYFRRQQSLTYLYLKTKCQNILDKI